jgi:hypothetical protein
MLVEPRHLDQLLHPTFENEKAYQRDVITRGLGASPGAAVGKLVFTAGAFVWGGRLLCWGCIRHLSRKQQEIVSSSTCIKPSCC